MPKKKKEKPEKEEELEELAAMLKENSDSVEQGEEVEESELEKDVDDSNLNLQNLEFHQFMQLQDSREAGAPALERIAGSAPRPIFVGGIPRETTASGGADSKDEFKYVPGAENNNEPKYVERSEHYMESQNVDLTRIGKTRDTISQANMETSFQQAPELRQFGSESPARERTWAAERIDVARAGRRDPFERPEEKYEKYKPKFPK